MLHADAHQAHERTSDDVAPSFPPETASLLQQAFKAMFPVISPAAPNRFLGRHKAILELLGNRASLGTIQQWIFSRRRTPRWVRKIVHDELRVRAAELQRLADAIAAEQDGPGSGSNLVDYWQKKRAAEHAAQIAKTSQDS